MLSIGCISSYAVASRLIAEKYGHAGFWASYGRQSGSDRSSEICKEKAQRVPVQFGHVLAVRNCGCEGLRTRDLLHQGSRSDEQTKYVLTSKRMRVKDTCG
jgi:hypothetical protein